MIWDIDSLNLKLQELNKIDHKMTKKIIPSLLKVLKENEIILFIAYGKINNIRSLMTCTDRRIIIHSEDNSYNRIFSIIMIESINCIKGWIDSKIVLKIKDEIVNIEFMYRDSAEIMTFTINKLKEYYTENNSNNEASESSIDKIKRLKKLLDMGAITEEEFNNKKDELMNKI